MNLSITRLLRRSSALAILSAAFLLLAPAPTQAQAGLVGAGHGTYSIANGQGTLEFTFFIAEGRNGASQGYAVWKGPGSIGLWRVDSFMFDDGALLFAGQVLAIEGSSSTPFQVGQTVFTGFRDNGFGAVDETVSLSAVPPQFGNPTIQQIVALIGSPPPGAWRPLATGGVWTR